jgi:hypothetical protein
MGNADKLDAVDVLDWDYLCKISEFVEHPKDWNRGGVQRFAHRFTSVSEVEAQNAMLADLLNNATHLQSLEAAEEVIKALAKSLHADRGKLREFAKSIGVRLKRG